MLYLPQETVYKYALNEFEELETELLEYKGDELFDHLYEYVIKQELLCLLEETSIEVNIPEVVTQPLSFMYDEYLRNDAYNISSVLREFVNYELN